MVARYMTRLRDDSPRLTLTLDSWGATFRGTRPKENQDSFLNWPQNNLWVVADGVGSCNGGLASQVLTRALMQTPPITSLASQVFNVRTQLSTINSLFLQQAAEVRQSNGTASTVVALTAYQNQAACLWAGDSRCYLLRQGTLYQCTKDHTLRQKKIDTGELTPSETKRMIKGNVITNAVGMQESLFLDEVQFQLETGDRFLLCSDGLSSILSPDALTVHLKKAHAQAAVESLCNAIAPLEQPDNVTFIVVFATIDT